MSHLYNISSEPAVQTDVILQPLQKLLYRRWEFQCNLTSINRNVIYTEWTIDYVSHLCNILSVKRRAVCGGRDFGLQGHASHPEYGATPDHCLRQMDTGINLVVRIAQIAQHYSKSHSNNPLGGKF